MSGESWVTLDEGDELVTVCLPRILYDRIRQFGPPRRVLAEIVTSVDPPRRQGIFPIDTGEMVNVNLVVNQYVKLAAERMGEDHVYR